MPKTLTTRRFRRIATVGALVTLLGLLATPARADEVRDEQWQLGALHASQAWRHANGAGVTVAVLDSGVDAKHPDLAGQVLPGVDVVDGSTDGRKDLVGHGTTVAALIAGRGDDDSGVMGLAYRAKILPVRVLNRENRYDDAANVAKGLRWAVDNGAKVVNLSLGGAGRSEELADALVYAFDHDVVVVACAGNIPRGGRNPGELWYPARQAGVLAVTGLTPQGTFWPASITGPQSVLSAPGADLIGARPGGYWTVEGTSFAAPLVAAAAALVRSRWPHMSAANVVNRLISTADDRGKRGRDAEFGFGEVNPYRALTSNVPEVAANPLDVAEPGTTTLLHHGTQHATHHTAAAGAATGSWRTHWPGIALTLLLITGIGYYAYRRRWLKP